MKNPIEFMENYSKWVNEATEQMKKELSLTNGGYDQERDYFNEDGEAYGKHFTMVAGVKIPSTIQKTKYNFKVTAWKDSKYYYEI